jgi:HSP20 family protein
MNLKTLLPWKREERPLARRISDTDPFGLLQRRMNDLFENIFERSSPALWSGAGEFLPQVDVSETDREVLISAELPGIEQKHVEVMLTGNTLTIKGEKKEEKEADQDDFHHSERSYGFFQRDVELPQGISADGAKAKFKNGVLKVTIPKKPEAQSSRNKIQLLGD